MLQLKRILPFVWFSGMPVLFSGLVLWMLKSTNVEAFINNEWYILALTFLLISLLMGLAMIPSTFVAIILGYLGGWSLFPCMIVSYIIASLLGYCIGNKSDANFWLNLIKSKKRGQEVLSKIENHSPVFIFSCRLSPILPFGLTNVLFGIFNIKLKDFILYGALGMLPRTILSTWIGIEANTMIEAFGSQGSPKYYNFIFIGLFFVSSALLFRFFFSKK